MPHIHAVIGMLPGSGRSAALEACACGAWRTRFNGEESPWTFGPLPDPSAATSDAQPRGNP